MVQINHGRTRVKVINLLERLFTESSGELVVTHNHGITHARLEF